MSTSDRLPGAVLFDMDGTLVETEQLWVEAQKSIVTEQGGQWLESLEPQLIGLNVLEGAGLLRETTGIDLAAEEIVRQQIALVDQAMRTGPLTWCAGIPELLERLRQAGIPALMVTSSYRMIAEAVLDVVAPGIFQGSVAGDEVQHPKPHPEPYLTAAKKAGVSIEDCLILEDSPIGIASALASGAVAVGIPNMLPIDSQPGLSVLRSAEELDDALMRRLMSGEIVNTYTAVS